MPHIICVGAVYMDTILTVPDFPREDTKTRATNMIRRRGGNVGNTLEVLSQLLPDNNLNRATSTYRTELSLFAVLPDPQSADTRAVIASLPDVSTRHYVYRQGQPVAASSYIIQSAANHSRTIVSSNPLHDLTHTEFTSATQSLLDQTDEEVWFHFEGRGDPLTMFDHLYWLRRDFGYDGRVKISIELEKPERDWLNDLREYADVVFYSKEWAQAAGKRSPSEFIKTQVQHTHDSALLVCTWGDKGAAALRKVPQGRNVHSRARAWKPLHSDSRYSQTPVDTVGAGDTFIAGMLYAYVHQKAWGVDDRLIFANELAGRKVHQQGFAGLGQAMKSSNTWVEKLKEGNANGIAPGDADFEPEPEDED
ncbi:hypothetical protein E8E13_003854 [Curvularia kusanoi]|uniref:Carbohydrate kinase PfkB domain-containing protein n=1 Tax=Curvularia kusanoi TaxID=90978 RepID=A0A9P4TBQ5_CURKU|nr:hypothetical protein E8E13_003854 [Curvularia kusanoi]